MLSLRKHTDVIRLTAVVLIGSLLHACYSWRTQALDPTRFAGPHPPQQVRVTLASGVQMMVERPVISGDSLIGRRPVGSPVWAAIPDPRTQEGSVPADPSRRVAFALADMREVALEEFDARRSALFVVGLGVTLALVVAATKAVNPPPPPPSQPPPSCAPNNCWSCPHVYSWDGRNWRLDSGTFGGAIMRALARTDIDNLDFAVPRDGVLRLKVENELDETDYLDELTVLAVDHDPDVTVAPDGRGQVHTLGHLIAPVSARDFRGRDALARVRAADGWNWESNPSGRDTARQTDLRDGLELEFLRPAGVLRAHLVVDGNNTPWAAYLLGQFVAAHGRATEAWYDSLEANPAEAHRLFARIADEAFLRVSVWTGERWEDQGRIWESSPELVKRQVLTLDLSTIPGDTVRVRLESAPSLWLIDRVALDFATARPITVRELRADSTRDRAGRDIKDLVAARDGRAYQLERGDGAELFYRVPPVPPGQSRSYLLRSSGWYHIHAPATGAPQEALLHRFITEPGAISRFSVARLNEALQAMETAAR
jgi:hypothetical protein